MCVDKLPPVWEAFGGVVLLREEVDDERGELAHDSTSQFSDLTYLRKRSSIRDCSGLPSHIIRFAIVCQHTF